VIDFMPEQKKTIQEKRYGGTMRLGGYNCEIKSGTISSKAYRAKKISERHRHRYELNNQYRDILEKKGMVMAGLNPERGLVEIIEIKKHPFFLGTQFHPEFKSNPIKPHPLFKEFIKACIARQR
jgi:CTP synthase